MQERLNKYIARCGLTSRRKADKMIKKGQIIVNGEVVNEGVHFIDSNFDEVYFNGIRLFPRDDFTYYALYKPRGYISTTDDPHADKIVMSLVPKFPKVFPVGRLDKDSEGLMILTNDGDFALRLTHPRYEHEKEYRVSVKSRGLLTPSIINKKIKRMYEESEYPPYRLELLEINQKEALFKFILKEGKKRQIRILCKSMGFIVTRLVRVRIENLLLDSLRVGKFIKITPDKVLSAEKINKKY